MYDYEALDELHTQFCQQLPPTLAAQLPMPPTIGSWDPAEVLEADFFFA